MLLESAYFLNLYLSRNYACVIISTTIRESMQGARACRLRHTHQEEVGLQSGKLPRN